MIRSEHMKSCLTAQICFLLFKGPGSFKKNFLIAEMWSNRRPIDRYHSHPPSFFILHFLEEVPEMLNFSDIYRHFNPISSRDIITLNFFHINKYLDRPPPCGRF